MNLDNYFRTEYAGLTFVVEFEEDTVLSRDKSSAIRGGMGEMLLRANCVKDRKCDSCQFESECVVQRILYSQMAKAPEFMSQGNSVGYSVICTDSRRFFCRGA